MLDAALPAQLRPRWRKQPSGLFMPLRQGFGLGLVGGLTAGGISPATLPGASQIESWHMSQRGVTMESMTLEGGTAHANAVTFSGNLNQSMAPYVDIVGAGSRGTATFDFYIDGGSTPYVSGLTTAASVSISGLGLAVQFPVGTYSADNTYTGLVNSWNNLTPKTRTLVSSGVGSQKPTMEVGPNGRFVMHSIGSNSPRVRDITSDWATVLAGGSDTAFSIFMVCKTNQASPSGTQYWFSIANQGSANQRFGITGRNSGAYGLVKLDDVATNVTVEGGTLDTGYHVLTIIHHGTTVDMSEDGVSLFSGSSQNVGSCTFDIVELFALGTSGGASSQIEGSIGELITYHGVHPDPGAIEDYLAAGWGL